MAQPVHDADEAVQRLRVGVRHRMLEVVEGERLPEGEGSDQVGEVGSDLGRDAPVP